MGMDPNGNPFINNPATIIQRIYDHVRGRIRVQSSARGAYAVTPSDSVNLPQGVTHGIYVGVAGDLSVVMEDGKTALFVGLSAGIIHPIAAIRIRATGTAADNIMAVY